MKRLVLQDVLVKLAILTFTEWDQSYVLWNDDKYSIFPLIPSVVTHGHIRLALSSEKYFIVLSYFFSWYIVVLSLHLALQDNLIWSAKQTEIKKTKS